MRTKPFARRMHGDDARERAANDSSHGYGGFLVVIPASRVTAGASIHLSQALGADLNM
jgi:hypothetical protein